MSDIEANLEIGCNWSVKSLKNLSLDEARFYASIYGIDTWAVDQQQPMANSLNEIEASSSQLSLAIL